ncbi:MAG TPA: enoyl-CoA hydratase-related protein [Burkholderiales bacterium]|nr:enoyl-CoA hydratase-related protein [Burkholderiales bacterium]
MDFQRFKRFKFELDGKVLTVTLNQPEKLNPIDSATEKELLDFLHEAADDSSFNVVVLTGAGRAFSSGGDIQHMQTIIDDPSLFDTVRPKRTVLGLIDFPKPIIAKVNGPAIGLGATIALLCDVVFASPNAKFADPHVNVGFTAGDGGAIIWPQLIGYTRAKEYLLTGDSISASEAERIGLINHVVPAEELDQRVSEFAQKLARGATKSINWTKQLANIGLRQVAAGLMDASIAYEALSNITKDHAEAVKAFLEKRKPQFTGE